MSARRQKIIQDLDISGGSGIEIGPLMWPVVTKDEGRITYVDWADTETLRRKHGGDPAIDPARIVEVDAVWGEKTLAEAVGTGERFDYLIASHVIEHVPDLIGWLNEIFEVLKADGQLRLVVPDKRFTFDILRRETELSDVLDAHLAKARRPSPGLILDFIINFVAVDAARIWNREVDATTLERVPNAAAGALDVARRSRDSGDYVDIHCWVFSPVGFGRLLEQMVAGGFVDCRCTAFHGTDHNTNEFFVGMARAPDREAAVASWRRMQAQASAHDAALSIGVDMAAKAAAEDASRLEQELALTKAELAAAQAGADRAERQIAALLQSRSWRFTAPLRRLSDGLAGRR